MHESIFRSAFRALAVTFAVVLGLCLGMIFLVALVGSFGSNSYDNSLTSVNTQEILPNAEGKRKTLSDSVPVILQVDIKGVIGMDSLDTKTVRQQLIESREGNLKNSRVKALLLNINTPGGTVADADGIYREILQYKQKYQVPVYAFIDGLCASGGMYVALAADKIYASEISLIGSVGVIAPAFINVTKLLDKVGVEALTISAGKDKDALNPLRPWKPGEEENYRNIIDYYYDHFVNLVTTHRPEITKDKLVQDFGAHVFPAPKALENGFIDVSGASLEETLKALTTEVGIDGEDYQVIRLENKGWVESLFSAQTMFFQGKIKHQFSFSQEIDVQLKNQFLYLYAP